MAWKPLAARGAGAGLTKGNDRLSPDQGSQERSTAQKWLLTLADQAVVSAAGFLTSVIIGRTCAKEQLGFYLLGLSLIAFLIEPLNAFVWSPYTAFSPRLRGTDHARYAGSTLIYQGGLSGGAVLALIGTGVLLATGRGPTGFDAVIWMLAISISFLLFREYARRVCFAALRMKAALLMDMSVTGVQGVLLLSLAFQGWLSAAAALGVMGFSCGLAGLIWLMRNRGIFQFSRIRASSDLKQNWSFGKWVMGDSLAFFLGCELYPWMLSGLHDAAAVGTLAACLGVVGLTSPFLQGYLNYLPAKAAQTYAQGGLQALRSLVVNFTVVIGAVFGLLSIFIIIFGNRLVEFFYGPQYRDTGLIIAILTLNVLVYALSLGVKFGLWAIGRVDINFKINLLRIAVTFTLGFWLVKAFGLLGASLGLLLGSLSVCTLNLVIFIKLFYLLPSKQIN